MDNIWLKYLDTKAQAILQELHWCDTIIFMDVEYLHKLGPDNLLPNALSRREELITPKLLMIAEGGLNDVEQDFLDEV